MKVLILVLSMNDGEHYSQFFETQKETWDSIDVDGFKTFYYFGNCLENKIVNNEIHLTVNESLFTTSKKFIESLKLIKDFDFDYIIRTNSSSYIDKIKIKEFLENKPNEKFISGIIGSHQSVNFVSGACFFMSKDIVNFILENEKDIDLNIIDDLSLGYFFKKHNLTITDKDVTRFDSKKEHLTKTHKISAEHFHYRILTGTSTERHDDIEIMKLIHELKLKKYNKRQYYKSLLTN
jgi:hypothetical protein